MELDSGSDSLGHNLFHEPCRMSKEVELNDNFASNTRANNLPSSYLGPCNSSHPPPLPPHIHQCHARHHALTSTNNQV